jgi:hypothetical protein
MAHHRTCGSRLAREEHAVLDYFTVVPFIIEMWPGNEQKKP